MQAVFQLAQFCQEGDPVHDRHVPVEENGVRHHRLAGVQGRQSVLRFTRDEIEGLEYALGDLADHLRVIDDQDLSHRGVPFKEANYLISIFTEGQDPVEIEDG